jgi:hypothetical protein
VRVIIFLKKLATILKTDLGIIDVYLKYGSLCNVEKPMDPLLG